MSNCLLGEDGLPIVRTASILALRATARGAASALTRRGRRAVCSSYCRHNVPAGDLAIPGRASRSIAFNVMSILRIKATITTLAGP